MQNILAPSSIRPPRTPGSRPARWPCTQKRPVGTKSGKPRSKSPAQLASSTTSGVPPCEHLFRSPYLPACSPYPQLPKWPPKPLPRPPHPEAHQLRAAPVPRLRPQPPTRRACRSPTSPSTKTASASSSTPPTSPAHQTLTLDLTSAQLNDVLQTLTAVDLGGGRVTSANYQLHHAPRPATSRNLPFALGSQTDDPSPTQQDLYTALRGAKRRGHRRRPRLHRPHPVSRNPPPPLRSVRMTSQHDTASHLSDPVLTLIADTGATRSLDPHLQLPPSASSTHRPPHRPQHLPRPPRTATATRASAISPSPTDAPANPTTPRELRVSFLSEVPDLEVHLPSSSSPIPRTAVQPPGTPQPGTPSPDRHRPGLLRHRQHHRRGLAPTSTSPSSPAVRRASSSPSHNPIYTRRPEIPIAQDAQLTPQTHDSAIDMLKEDGASTRRR